MRSSYNFSRRPSYRSSHPGTITTEITFFRTAPSPLSQQSNANSYFYDNERFSIGRPRWEDEEDHQPPRNPHQTQNLSQYELTGIPEPDFSHAPWRPDRTASPEDEYEYYLRQYENDIDNYVNEDYDTFISHTPSPPRHFRGRLSRHNSSTSSYSSSSRRNTNIYSYSSTTRGVVNARTLRPGYPSITHSYSTTSSNSGRGSNRARTIRVSVSTNPAPAKKKEEKPKPTVTLSHRKIEQKDVDEEQACSICLEPFKKDEKVAVLKCTHFFHEACIKPWVEDHFTCPICRADIADDPKEKKKKK